MAFVNWNLSLVLGIVVSWCGSLLIDGGSREMAGRMQLQLAALFPMSDLAVALYGLMASPVRLIGDFFQSVLLINFPTEPIAALWVFYWSVVCTYLLIGWTLIFGALAIWPSLGRDLSKAGSTALRGLFSVLFAATLIATLSFGPPAASAAITAAGAVLAGLTEFGDLVGAAGALVGGLVFVMVSVAQKVITDKGELRLAARRPNRD